MPEQVNAVENRNAQPTEYQPTQSAPPETPDPNAFTQSQNDLNRSLGLGRVVDEVV
ncbi:hypothetical protein HY522_08790 [bacterium]|nr:hypothetical protein [bacterium]